MKRYHQPTRLIASLAEGEALVGPLVRSSAFVDSCEWSYTRLGNPTVDRVQRRLAELEEAEAAVLTSSGSAALLAGALALTSPGDLVLVSRHICEDNGRLLLEQLPALGRRAQVIDLTEASWRKSLTVPGAVLLFAEVLSNPTLRLVDLRALCEQAKTRGLRTLIDATLATPLNVRPLELGADLVIHSAGKFLNGHSDLVAGVAL